MAQAAKFRVTRFENTQNAGLNVLFRASRLCSEIGSECSLAHVDSCRRWADQNNFLHHLAAADRQFSGRLGREDSLRDALGNSEGFQKLITPFFRTTPVGASMLHLRRRLDGWRTMGTLPGHRPGRAQRIMQVLLTKATPRVQAAYLRTICNGWCTRHRFQQQGNCLFGCGRGFDGLVHYASCSVVEQLFTTSLNLGGHRGRDALIFFYA